MCLLLHERVPMNHVLRGVHLTAKVWSFSLTHHSKPTTTYIVSWLSDVIARLITVFLLIRVVECIQDVPESSDYLECLALIALLLLVSSTSAATGRVVIRQRYSLATQVAVGFAVQYRHGRVNGANSYRAEERGGPPMADLAQLTRFELECFAFPLKLVATVVYLLALIRVYPIALLSVAIPLALSAPIWFHLLRSRKVMMRNQKQEQGELNILLRSSAPLETGAALRKLQLVFWPQEAESQNSALATLFQGLALSTFLLALLFYPPNDLLATLAATLFLSRLAASELAQAMNEMVTSARFASAAHGLVTVTKGDVNPSDVNIHDHQEDA